MELLRAQAERFGTQIIDDVVTRAVLRERPFLIEAGKRQMQAEAVIIATGASAKWLDIPSEKALSGHGVSACATCDGFFFRNKDIGVVGGGDTAMEEALFLTKMASKVTVVHRRGDLRASKVMQQRAFANPKIGWEWNQEVVEVLGDKKSGVTGIKSKNTQSGEHKTLPMNGLFVAIGVVLGLVTFLLVTACLYYGAIWLVIASILLAIDVAHRRWRPGKQWWRTIAVATGLAGALLAPTSRVAPLSGAAMTH